MAITCSRCNSQNDDDNNACIYCGQLLKDQPVQNAEIDPVAPPVYQPQQNTYAPQPVYNNNVYPNAQQINQTVSVGEYIGIWAWCLIPFVGGLIYLIMLFVKAFGGNTKPSMANFCKSQLILMLIGFGLSIILTILIAALGLFSFSSLGSLYY